MARRWGNPVTVIAGAELLYPETALAIALLETGGFSARWMMKHHNWFGFKPSTRHHHSGTRHGYATYATVDDALADYQEWEGGVVQRYNLYTEARFRAWLPTYYVPDEHQAEWQGKLDYSLSLINQF